MIRVELSPWRPVTTSQLAGTLALGAAFIALLWMGDPTWTEIIDHANLAFHEAGHMFYGFFGDTAALYGGVAGQLTFPLLAAVTFFVRREPHAVAGAAMWGCQNLWNIARYMADARARELPLVGGTEHDFEHIFRRWGVLDDDRLIAGWTRGAAWLGLLAAAAWLAWRWYRDRSPREPSG